MNYIRKIISEELSKNFLIAETYETTSTDVFEKGEVSKDDIIYNYELGRMFANNTLQVDINNLNSYTLEDYIPKSISQEKWTFDFLTAVGATLIVDISRQIRGGKSFWSMVFGILGVGENIPKIKDMIEDVEGYDNFVKIANENMSKNINTSKF